MPNTLDVNGLTIKTVTEIVADLTAAMQLIYGADINVDSNSPDGQLINLFAQSCEDILELLVDVYGGFGVEGAYGTILDQRVAINGIARRQGTYTTTPVAITVNQALTLTGLDALDADPTAQVFTVADNAGNQFYLAVTQTPSIAGTNSYSFRAVDIGAVEVTANTITNQTTTVLGVTGVNNPTTSGTTVGVNEETDAELKIRHDKSFALASIGPADAVSAALLALADVVDAYVVENFTNGTVSGTGAHSIWCIVRGGAAADIAQAIYSKKGIGCDMRGAVTHSITRPDGNTFTAKWDNALAEALYVRFTINGRTSGTAFDTALIADQLAAALNTLYKLGDQATVGDVVNAMLTIAPNAYLTNIGVSDDGISYVDAIVPTTAQHYFTVAAANIDITT